MCGSSRARSSSFFPQTETLIRPTVTSCSSSATGGGMEGRCVTRQPGVRRLRIKESSKPSRRRRYGAASRHPGGRQKKEKCHRLRPLLTLPPWRPGRVDTCARLPRRVPLSSLSPALSLDDERLPTRFAGGPVFSSRLHLPSRSPLTPAVTSSDQLICPDTA